MPTTRDHAHLSDLSLYYERTGVGDPVVLVHGGLLTIDLSWSSLIPRLAEGHEVIAVELQGHGHTQDIDRPFTPTNNSADLIRLLDHLGLDRAVFVGHSTGAATCWEIAIRHPERISKLVSMSGSVKPDALVPEFADPEKLMQSPRVPTPKEMEAMREAYTRLSATPEKFEEFQAKIASAPDSEGYSDDQIAGVRCPVLQIMGDLDFVTFDHLSVMQQLVPDCAIGVLPATTHTQVPTRVDLYWPMLAQFLGIDPA